MNVERILTLADLVETLPMETHQYEGDPDKRQFCMGHWQYSCGTPSCIAGWAAHIAYTERVGPFVGAIPVIAAHYLGLSASAADELFLATSSNHPIHTLTPKAAAYCLRNLVKTGRVAWVKAMKETSNVAPT